MQFLLWYSWFCHVHYLISFLTGIYSWIGVNFELGRFDHSHDPKGRCQGLKLFDILNLVGCDLVNE